MQTEQLHLEVLLDQRQNNRFERVIADPEEDTRLDALDHLASLDLLSDSPRVLDHRHAEPLLFLVDRLELDGLHEVAGVLFAQLLELGQTFGLH